MSNELKGLFKAQGLPPFTSVLRDESMSDEAWAKDVDKRNKNGNSNWAKWEKIAWLGEDLHLLFSRCWEVFSQAKSKDGNMTMQ